MLGNNIFNKYQHYQNCLYFSMNVTISSIYLFVHLFTNFFIFFSILPRLDLMFSQFDKYWRTFIE